MATTKTGACLLRRAGKDTWHAMPRPRLNGSVEIWPDAGVESYLSLTILSRKQALRRHNLCCCAVLCRARGCLCNACWERCSQPLVMLCHSTNLVQLPYRFDCHLLIYHPNRNRDGVLKLWDLGTEDGFPVSDWREHAQG